MMVREMWKIVIKLITENINTEKLAKIDYVEIVDSIIARRNVD